MFTKVFKNVMALLVAPSSQPYGQNELTFKDYSGTTRYHSFRIYYPYNVSYGFSIVTSGYGVKVGSGTTAPTEDDYNLESLITSGLSGSVVVNRTIEDDYANLEMLVTITNTSASDITISEIGFFQQITYGSSTSITVAMLDRTLLDEPITVPSNESATITYTLKAPIFLSNS